jgi:hypothetical protein
VDLYPAGCDHELARAGCAVKTGTGIPSWWAVVLAAALLAVLALLA